MGQRRIWLVGAVLVAGVGYAAHRASLGGVRGAEAVRGLYDRLAPAYDATAWGFRLVGAARLQQRAVDLIDLRAGDAVVELGCGTGVNLPVLARAVGPSGRVVGVDLSAGMLERARRRAARHGLDQVTLIQADMRGFELPAGTAAVLATASLEMVPEHEAVVGDLAAQLASAGGRLAVAGLRRPPGWPEWAIAIARAGTALFGVTREYEGIEPWRSVREHMDEVAFESAAGGGLYLIVARTRPAPDATGSDPR